nr:hypothetical protein [uncultured Campylobacter sp.]
MKFLKFLGARHFGLRAAERRFEILKFLGAKRFGLRTTTGFLKFTPMPSNNGYEILNFTPEPHKFKPAPAVRLNFALNSVPPTRAVKFENGVKFKAAAKFKRDAR